MKPPVEAPTSRQSRPATSMPSASRRVLQLDPAARDVARRRVDDQLGLRLDQLARPRSATGPSRPTRTPPARTAAAALVRDPAEPAVGKQRIDPLAFHAINGTCTGA